MKKYHTSPITTRSIFHTHNTLLSLFVIAHLEEGGQEVGNSAQDSVQDALDNDEQTVDDEVQGADQATESEDQRLDEREDTIWKRGVSDCSGGTRRVGVVGLVTYRDRAW